MIEKRYKCDLCQKQLDPRTGGGFRLQFISKGFELVSLTHSQGSETIVCLDCCRCISAQAGKYTSA